MNTSQQHVEQKKGEQGWVPEIVSSCLPTSSLRPVGLYTLKVSCLLCFVFIPIEKQGQGAEITNGGRRWWGKYKYFEFSIFMDDVELITIVFGADLTNIFRLVKVRYNLEILEDVEKSNLIVPDL